jgi:hypothetical protein
MLAVLFTGIASAQTDTKKKWPQEYRNKFLTDCFSTAKPLGEDSARRYCACMANKLEAKYPDSKEVDKLTEADFEKPELKQLIRDCLSMKWPEKDRNTFLASCEKNATPNVGAEKAKSYCSCMLDKIQVKYARAEDADKITKADLEKPEWKAMLKACLQ